MTYQIHNNLYSLVTAYKIKIRSIFNLAIDFTKFNLILLDVLACVAMKVEVDYAVLNWVNHFWNSDQEKTW